MRVQEKRKQLVKRRSTLLNAESARVITRPHIPGDNARTKDLIDRVSKLSDDDVHNLLEFVFQDFSGRHRNFRETLQKNFDRIAEHVPKSISLSSEQQLLLGAYSTAEYSVESAALFNPSVVIHPDQKGTNWSWKNCYCIKCNCRILVKRDRRCIVFGSYQSFGKPTL